jgi:hypothetical protein
MSPLPQRRSRVRRDRVESQSQALGVQQVHWHRLLADEGAEHAVAGSGSRGGQTWSNVGWEGLLRVARGGGKRRTGGLERALPGSRWEIATFAKTPNGKLLMLRHRSSTIMSMSIEFSASVSVSVHVRKVGRAMLLEWRLMLLKGSWGGDDAGTNDVAHVSQDVRGEDVASFPGGQKVVQTRLVHLVDLKRESEEGNVKHLK